MDVPESTYVRRAAESRLLDEIERVRHSERSRMILLYGPGGVGKTRMLRTLADTRTDPASGTVWVAPLDMDDSEYSSLDNVLHRVALAIDPLGTDFGPFIDRLQELRSDDESREPLAIQQGRTITVFQRCHAAFRARLGATVVVALDTVEVVRGSDLLDPLINWMSSSPGTAFVLSGRPPDGLTDPIVDSFRAAAPDAVAVVDLGGFTEEEGRLFLRGTDIGSRLPSQLVDTLLSLTERHPLWLELAVDYLRTNSPPPETEASGLHDAYLRESFRRRLITPFRSTEFWSEAIKRLAVVRHNVDSRVWRAIMADRPLPPDVPDWPSAWEALLTRPWIRPRANGRDVTLHDALAEELLRRLIPLHDHDSSWRRSRWRDAATAFAESPGEYDDVIQAMDATLVDDDIDPGNVRSQQLAQLEIRKRRIERAWAARLYYLLLSDFERGAQQVAKEFSAAASREDLRYMQLVLREIRRFLPSSDQQPVFDAIGVVVEQFRTWLGTEPVAWSDIALNVARYLVKTSQAGPAVQMLRSLPDSGDAERAYQVAREQGNACMRLPGMVLEADRYFQVALAHARSCPPSSRQRLVAEAHKELGYFARNVGRWDEADVHYGEAFAAIRWSGQHPGVVAEQASISTNWGYLKALRGDYSDAYILVEEAVRQRTELGSPLGVAISRSTVGEVCRYDQQFSAAWEHYCGAERILVAIGNKPWLGQIYQEQAICLVQAAGRGEYLQPDPVTQAKKLIGKAMKICGERAVRWYPSALNRAGRIHAPDDHDLGLRYLTLAVEKAEAVADGWFLSASLVELLELNYHAWETTRQPGYREAIVALQPRIADTMTKYSFPDLGPRRDLVNAHLAVHDALAAHEPHALAQVAPTYGDALLALARKRSGSHGVAALDAEFARFADLYAKLAEPTRRQWYEHLRTRWLGESTHLSDQLDRLR